MKKDEIITNVATIILTMLVNAIIIYFLWNWLMPEIFGLSELTVVQSFGVSVLSSLLFKSNENKK